MTTFNPYQAPEADLMSSSSFLDAGELRPIPFEDLELEPRFWRRVWAMFREAFRAPLELAGRVPVTKGLGAPWRFQLVMTIPVFLLIFAVSAFLGVILFAALKENPQNGPAPAWVFALVPLVYLVLLPPMEFINMVVIGALTHGCLWIWGGLGQGAGMRASLRATGYVMGYLMVVAFIPLVGSLVTLAAPAFLGMALARIHRTETWRGVCAAYTPLLVLGLAFIGLMILLV